ncbi:MAG: YihA family ribosome biogenesis GTP-binding protein [candidate division Zixibacteria bacterium]|nr:YihA family ribosome biogenesis GTP-binding protein [candidate division Zixibacteria bacterium]
MQFKNADYTASYYNLSDIPKTGYPEIAFAGRSNVGKSSLINKILNRKKLAQVSKTPGKTKALNYFEIDRKYYFVDLPGFGYAHVSKKERDSWGELIEAYLSKSNNLKGIVHIIDSRRGIMEIDISLVNFVNYLYREHQIDLKMLWILSKSDKLKSKAKSDVYKKALQDLQCDPGQLIFFSTTNGQGVTEVRKLIMEMLIK